MGLVVAGNITARHLIIAAPDYYICDCSGNYLGQSAPDLPSAQHLLNFYLNSNRTSSLWISRDKSCKIGMSVVADAGNCTAARNAGGSQQTEGASLGDQTFENSPMLAIAQAQ